jgi:hypothetical protein
MTRTLSQSAEGDANAALRRLAACDEVLQICYWYQGEGFGDRFTADAILPFLNSERLLVADALEALVGNGDMERTESAYVFTAGGKRKAGRLFHEAFADFQGPTHGECPTGCCDDDGCDSEHDHERSPHTRGPKRG